MFITTPHFSSAYSYQDPTHIRHLSYELLYYFTTDTRHSNFYTDRRFEMVEREMDFGKSFPFDRREGALRPSPRRYEKHFAFMFPAQQPLLPPPGGEVGARPMSLRSRTWLAIYARALHGRCSGRAHLPHHSLLGDILRRALAKLRDRYRRPRSST